jgi:VanZ family protein
MIRLKGFFQHRQVSYWLPVYLYAGLIFLLSSFPLPASPVKVSQIDKIAHFFEYAILALLIYRACVTSPQRRLYQGRVDISVIISVLYAFSDEFHQYFVPQREMDLYDFLMDTLGVCVAILLVSWLQRHRR